MTGHWESSRDVALSGGSAIRTPQVANDSPIQIETNKRKSRKKCCCCCCLDRFNILKEKYSFDLF